VRLSELEILAFTEDAPALSRTFGASAPCYRIAEDVAILTLVVAELERSNVEGQMPGGYPVSIINRRIADPPFAIPTRSVGGECGIPGVTFDDILEFLKAVCVIRPNDIAFQVSG
jgi:hypothetical protein